MKKGYTVRTGGPRKGFEYYFFERLWAATELLESCTSKDNPVIFDKSGRIIKRKG